MIGVEPTFVEMFSKQIGDTNLDVGKELRSHIWFFRSHLKYIIIQIIQTQEISFILKRTYQEKISHLIGLC